MYIHMWNNPNECVDMKKKYIYMKKKEEKIKTNKK